MQEQQCALIRMISEKETPAEKIIRYVSGDDEKVEELSCLFDYNVKEYGRNYHLPREMKRVNTSGEYVFDADCAYSYIFDMTMFQVLPRVTVKEEYRDKLQIAWCPYVGINVVNKATMTCGDKKITQNFDTVWSNIDYQYYKTSKIEHNNRYCGNIPILTEWTDSLPEFRLRVPQPWFFTRDLPFPLFLIKERVFFTYLTKKNISSLLRVRVWDGKNWIPRKINSKIMECLNYADSGNLRPPIMIAEYSKITAKEQLSISENPNHYVTEDIKHFETRMVDKDNPKISVELNISEPIKAIFYVAENCDATAMNNLSNFTTNVDCIEEGLKPIKSIYPKYNDTELIPFSAEFTAEVYNDYLEAHSPKKHFPGSPCDPGYSCIPIAYDLFAPYHDSFKSGKISIDFELSDKEEDSEKEENKYLSNDISVIDIEEKVLKHSYKVHVYALIVKKLSFTPEGILKINTV